MYFIMVLLKWSIQLCIEQYIQYKRLHFVQKSMGLPVTGRTPDAVRTAIIANQHSNAYAEVLYCKCDGTISMVP